MNERHRYTIHTQRTDNGISHQCTMSYQRMSPEELKNLDELHRLYKMVIDIHETFLNKEKKVYGLETKIGIGFKK